MARKAKTTAPDPGRYFFEVYQHADLAGDWRGWKLRGKWLISPHGDRLCPTRLIGILVTERLRISLNRKQVHQVRVDRQILEFRARARAALVDAPRSKASSG